MRETGIMPLSSIASGKKGMVVALTGGRQFQHRLVSMGLNIGREIEIVHSSNGNHGPTLIGTGETRLAIGQGMADRIMVAVDQD